MSGEGPSKEDVELLDRLNALKNSSVQFGQRNELHEIPDEYDDADESSLTDLTARFAGLRRISVDDKHGGTSGDPDINIPSQFEGGDDIDDVDTLIAQLREKSSGQIKDELKGGEDVDDLLKEAKQFVKTSEKLQKESKDLEMLHTIAAGKAQGAGDEGEEEEDDEKQEEKEAEEYLQQVMDDLKTESLKRPDPDEQFPSPEDRRRQAEAAQATSSITPTDNPASQSTTTILTPVELPSLPSTSSLPPPTSKPPSSTLSPIDLPSAPTANPVTITRRSDGQDKDKSWRKGVTSNEAPSWCCICSDDATLECLDCEFDKLFCLRCWVEYHLTEGGEEEREHRRKKFEKAG